MIHSQIKSNVPWFEEIIGWKDLIPILTGLVSPLIQEMMITMAIFLQ